MTGCSICSGETTCTTSIDGYYVADNGTATICDHDKCATCTSETECIIPCDEGCSTCD